MKTVTMKSEQQNPCKRCKIFLGDKWWIRQGRYVYCRECFLNSQAKETTIEWCEKQAKFYEKRLYKIT